MKKLVPRRYLANFKNNLKSVKLEGVGLTSILTILCIILVANIFRVINNGKKNYEVYLYEKNLLEQIKNDHEVLSYTLEFYSSDEAKKLLGREVLGLATANESLYKVKEPPEYLDKEVKLLNVSEKKDYKDFWRSLLKI